MKGMEGIPESEGSEMEQEGKLEDAESLENDEEIEKGKASVQSQNRVIENKTYSEILEEIRSPQYTDERFNIEINGEHFKDLPIREAQTILETAEWEENQPRLEAESRRFEEERDQNLIERAKAAITAIESGESNTSMLDIILARDKGIIDLPDEEYERLYKLKNDKNAENSDLNEIDKLKKERDALVDTIANPEQPEKATFVKYRPGGLQEDGILAVFIENDEEFVMDKPSVELRLDKLQRGGFNHEGTLKVLEEWPESADGLE